MKNEAATKSPPNSGFMATSVMRGQSKISLDLILSVLYFESQVGIKADLAMSSEQN